jgi:hypothetical protein
MPQLIRESGKSQPIGELVLVRGLMRRAHESSQVYEHLVLNFVVVRAASIVDVILCLDVVCGAGGGFWPSEKLARHFPQSAFMEK